MNVSKFFCGAVVAVLSVSSVAGKHQPPSHKKVEHAFFKCEASHNIEGGLYGGPFSYGEAPFKHFGPKKSACSSSEWVAIKFEEFKRLATEWHGYDWSKEGPYWNFDRSLCGVQEKVVFSCYVKKKLVSLCATPEITAKTGRLTYRFGLFGKTPELTYPTVDTTPEDAFSASFMSWPHKDYAAVSFSLADHTYTIYSNNEDFGEAPGRSYGAGVLVGKSKKIVADLWCEEPYQNKMWESLKEIGLPKPKALSGDLPPK